MTLVHVHMAFQCVRPCPPSQTSAMFVVTIYITQTRPRPQLIGLRWCAAIICGMRCIGAEVLVVLVPSIAHHPSLTGIRQKYSQWLSHPTIHPGLEIHQAHSPHTSCQRYIDNVDYRRAGGLHASCVSGAMKPRREKENEKKGDAPCFKSRVAHGSS